MNQMKNIPIIKQKDNLLKVLETIQHYLEEQGKMVKCLKRMLKNGVGYYMIKDHKIYIKASQYRLKVY